MEPSWSWASVDTSILHHYNELATRDRNNSGELNWKTKVSAFCVEGNGHYGVKGTLTISGPLRKLPLGDEQAQGGLLGQELDWAYIQNIHRVHICTDHYFNRRASSSVYPDIHAAPLTGPLHVLWLARGVGVGPRKSNRGLIEPLTTDVGLVLDPVQGHEDMFRRRGYFKQQSRVGAPSSSYLFADGQVLETRTISII